MQIMDNVLRDLRKIIDTVVIKYDTKASASETMESRKSVDLYMSAVQSRDSFHTYRSFSKQAVINAGVTNPTLQDLYSNDKTKIPRNLRDPILLSQRKLIISEYVEENNYYRNLMGIPDLGDLLFIYPDPAIVEMLGLDPNEAVHQYNIDEIYLLESTDELDRLKKEYPTKKYLNYLGAHAINNVMARNAKGFSILRMTKDIPDSFYEEFNQVYDQCREYCMTVVYNKDFGRQYNLYENFIALMIMVMTIQRIISNTFKYGIQYDFYDLSSIKMIFDAYNIPFINNLPIDYQRIIIRNLNSLLRYKSTDKVLYDILSLLGLDRVKIFKYFLFKEHRMDDNGNPIFLYKEVDDGNGGVQLVEDYEKMFNLFFQSVELKDTNISLALADNTNVIEYGQVVMEDPYWWDEDSELKKAIYEGEFNYAETKFLGLNVMYKLTEMLFEISYFFNMVIDKKIETSNISIELPRISEDKQFNLFDIVIMLCALVARKNKMAGNIIHTPSKALHIMGFNFSLDFAAIRREVRENPYLDNTINNYLRSTNITSAAGVNKLYDDIRNLNDFLVDKMARTNDIKVYRAYRKLFETLMVTQHMEKLFKKSDNTIAETFIEYLEDKDPVTADFIKQIDYDNIGEFVEHILFKVNTLVASLKYLHIVTDADGLMLTAALTLIRFFKSYTTDLASFNILYIMDSKYYNMIKLMDTIKGMSKTIQHSDTGLSKNYKDIITYILNISSSEMIELMDTLRLTSNIPTKDNITSRDTLAINEASQVLKLSMYLQDKLNSISSSMFNIGNGEHMEFNDTISYTAEFDPKEMLDLIGRFKMGVSLTDKDYVNLIDMLGRQTALSQFTEDLHSLDSLNKIDTFMRHKNLMDISEGFSMQDSMDITQYLNLNYSDIIKGILVDSRVKTDLEIKDTLVVEWEL